MEPESQHPTHHLPSLLFHLEALLWQMHLPCALSSLGSGKASPCQVCVVLSVCGKSRSRATPERGGRMRGTPA